MLFHPPRRYVLLALGGVLACSLGKGHGAESQDVPRFERDILPVLTKHCATCHGTQELEAGLDLRSLERLRIGGDSGPAVVARSTARSLIFQRVAAGEMPPEGPALSESEIDLLRRWIEGGAAGDGESGSAAGSQESGAREAEVLVRVFFTHCISCHGKEKQEAGLDLRSREAMVQGGKSGPALIPGNAEASLIYRRLLGDEMPPKKDIYGDENYVRRVSPDDIELLRRWIAEGAPADPIADVAASHTDRPPRREFWSFKPPTKPAAPRVVHEEQIRNSIDAFVLEHLEARGLTLSPSAPKLALMRRAYFDLIGLPPSPEEVTAYAADESPDAYERLIDRLLASPRYGERWAQHWLDAAGYADSHGKIDRDQFRPFIWRYRDYVIRSLQDDKPYNQFLAEQIAGDELPADELQKAGTSRVDAEVATGFLLTAADATDEAAFNSIPQRVGVVADQIDIFSTAVMGLTMECARCHSHKFDPISQRDYYRFSAIFQAALDPYDWRITTQQYYPARVPLERRYQRYIYDPADKTPPELVRFYLRLDERIQHLDAKLEQLASEYRKQAKNPEDQRLASDNADQAAGATASSDLSVADPGATSNPPHDSQEKLSLERLAERFPEFKKSLDAMRAEQEALRAQRDLPLAIHGVRDVGGEPTPVFQLTRGDPGSPLIRVQPGAPSLFDGVIESCGPPKSPNPGVTSGNRLALARWITQPKHPLTARVMVNRLWQGHFGRGLVATPGNFGAKGMPPTHPELLDWLATEFVDSGWSIKRIHRLIMLSSTYQQASTIDAARAKGDPDNLLLSRFPLRRLDGEAIRDALLKASGQLDERPFGPPDAVVRWPSGEVSPADRDSPQRRSIYLAKMRMRPVTILEQFDGAEMVPNCLQRTESTVPTQALQLYNSDLVRRCSKLLAEKIMSHASSNEERARYLYLAAFARPPTTEEVRDLNVGIEALRKVWQAEPAKRAAEDSEVERLAWTTYCHVVLNAPEFDYID